MELSYRSYQKVLNISLKPKQLTPVPKRLPLPQPQKIAKPKRDETQIKRRTKTGCLTCRKKEEM